MSPTIKADKADTSDTTDKPNTTDTTDTTDTSDTTDTFDTTDKADTTDTTDSAGQADKADFGVIGIGVMGRNLALNIEGHGFSVALFNRNPEHTASLVAQHKDLRLVATSTLEDLANHLTSPRKILIMIPAGAPVDQAIDALVPHLSPGDILIDGGNEFFENTERRAAALSALGLEYVGMGVSGGSEGARHGPSLMPGCSAKAYKDLYPILSLIAAQVADGPCVTRIGPGGSGHYVKMVHNGIEYGDMQLIAETYDLLKHVGGLSNAELAQTFAAWNEGDLESYLIEITAKIFATRDPESSGELVDQIVDTAQMKGTGSWTVKEGADLGAPIPTIASSVDARLMSAMKPLRLVASKLLSGPTPGPIGEAKAQIIADARAALYAAKMCSYAQGLGLLARASETHRWGLDLAEIARIWKAGCIIRAAFLGRIQEAFNRDSQLANLLFDATFAAELATRQDGWRTTITRAVHSGLPVATLTASLSYYDALRRDRLPANLTQAQRDFFGAHTFERLDRPGAFHHDWSAEA